MITVIPPDERLNFISDLTVGSYATYTVPAPPAGTTAVIVEFIGTGTNSVSKEADARKVGDTTSYKALGYAAIPDTISRSTRFVGLDGSNAIEVFINNQVTDVRIAAYLTSEDFFPLSPRTSLFSYGSFVSNARTPYDFSPVAPVNATAAVILYRQVSSAGETGSFARPGETEVRALDSFAHTSSLVVPLSGRVSDFTFTGASASRYEAVVCGFLLSSFIPEPIDQYIPIPTTAPADSWKDIAYPQDTTVWVQSRSGSSVRMIIQQAGQTEPLNPRFYGQNALHGFPVPVVGGVFRGIGPSYITSNYAHIIGSWGVSFQITGVNDDDTVTDGTQTLVHGLGLSGATGVDIDGHALTILEASDNTLLCEAFTVYRDTGLPYGAAQLTVTTATASTSRAITLRPDNTKILVTGAAVDTTYGLAQAGGADGDQWLTEDSLSTSNVLLTPDTNMVFTPAVPNGSTAPYWWYGGGAWTEDSYQVNGGGTQVIPPTYSNQSSTTYEQVSVNLATGWVNANPDGFGNSRLPSGLSMSPQGLVTGRPLSPQTVTGIVVNNSGVTSNAFDWAVTLGPAIPPDYQTRRVYIGLPYFTDLSNGWLNTDGSAFTVDLLPAGLTMDAAGLVTGTPTTEQEVNSVVSHRGVSSNPFAWIVTEAPPTGSLTDAKWNALRAAGYTGAISDMMLQWLQANGATSGHITDAWLEMLASKGYGPGQRNTLWYQYLGDQGYTGSLPDRELAFWLDGGALSVGTEVWNLAAFLRGEGWTAVQDGDVVTVTEGVHEWVFTLSEAEDGVYADDIPAPLRNDIDDYFGR